MDWFLIDQVGRLLCKCSGDTPPDGAITAAPLGDWYNLPQKWTGTEWVLDPLPDAEVVAFRNALIDADLFTVFKAEAGKDPKLANWFEYITVIARQDPSLLAIQVSAAISDLTMDKVFVSAAVNSR